MFPRTPVQFRASPHFAPYFQQGASRGKPPLFTVSGWNVQAKVVPIEARLAEGGSLYSVLLFIVYCIFLYLRYYLFVYYTYILRLANGTFYVGYSSDLKKRISYHNDGFVSSTKNFRPIQLVYYSAFGSKKKALDFEKYLKTSSGFTFRNKRLV